MEITELTQTILKQLFMKQITRILSVLALFGCIVTFYACSDDDDDQPTTFTLTTLTAGTTDLNGSTSGVDVPVNSPITATFNTDVDASTATTSNITLKRGFDSKNADITIATTGKVVTITPADDLSGGATYILNIGAGLKGTNAVAFTPVERSFKTAGTFVPDDQVAYFPFEDNGNDAIGTFDADVTKDVTFIAGRNAVAGKAAEFNGTTSIIEVPNGDDLLSDEFALSFWMDLDTASMKADGVSQKGHFVMGVGAFFGLQFEVNDHEEWFKFAGAQAAPTENKINDFFFNANGETLAPTGLDMATTVDEDYGKTGIRERINGWVQIVYVFSGSTKVRSIYINGEKVMEQDYKKFIGSGDAGLEPWATVTGLAFTPSAAAPATPDYYDNKWNFGFWTSSSSTFPSWGEGCCQYAGPDNNHFEGALDDVRFFDRAITSDEVQLMYDSEKP
jgi:hypothetical protein